MRDRELYRKLLGIESPWTVADVDVRMDAGEVEVSIERGSAAKLRCPECNKTCPGYDSRRRTWRHLDTMQFRTLLTAEVPRVKCANHGVKQIDVPWAGPGSRLTALLEKVVIDWLKEASASAVARLLGMSWDEVDGVMQRAVDRGLARRKPEPLRAIGIDETSFQKRHEYVTVVYNTDRSCVLSVTDGRTRKAIDDFYWSTPIEHLESLESISMDMSKAYISATLDHVPDAEKKIAFDRFHVAKHIGDAVNRVRREEHAELQSLGDEILKGSRYLWLQNPENMKPRQLAKFDVLKVKALKVARAWAIKEAARHLWHYSSRAWAEKAWKKLIGWMDRSRLPAIVAAGKTLRGHLWGIINAVVLGVTNAHLESVNSRIQALKKRACGYRNRDRFRAAIMFHCGGLDLYPVPQNTHTNP